MGGDDDAPAASPPEPPPPEPPPPMSSADAERARWHPALDDPAPPLVGEWKRPAHDANAATLCTSRRVRCDAAAPGVSKQLIRAAAPGALSPPEGSTCYAHYEMWQRDDPSAEVWSTRRESEPRQIHLSVNYAANPRSRDRHHAGIARCLRAMRVGERALFHLPPELAYGDEGNFTFPAVPPRCHVICDLELIAARGSAEEPETLRADMLFEERLARASEHRKRGNVAFGEGGDGDGDEKEAKTREARAEYEMALSFLTDDMMMQLPPGPHADAAAAEKLPAHLNLCACFLRLGRHDDAIDQANRALIVDPKCAKAYFRRGEARKALGRDDDARADYAEANELRRGAGDGEDPAIRRALRELDREDAKRARARKEVFGGLFGAGAGAGGGDGGGEVLKERRSPRERGRMGTSHDGEKTRGGEASRGERSDGGGGVFGRIALAFGFRGSRGAKR